jgi:DNA-binding protein YbaB
MTTESATAPDDAGAPAPPEDWDPLEDNIIVRTQRAIDEARFVGSAADGMVTATVRPPSIVVALTIEPEFVDRHGSAATAEHVLEAIADATAQAEDMLREQFTQLGFAVDQRPAG